MFGKKKSIERATQAILIEKKIFKSHDHGRETRKLMSMRKGTYNIHFVKNSNNLVYCLIFMTEKGTVTMYVDNPTYYGIKLNSLGILTSNKDNFVSFETQKIATEVDVRQLNW